MWRPLSGKLFFRPKEQLRKDNRCPETNPRSIGLVPEQELAHHWCTRVKLTSVHTSQGTRVATHDGLWHVISLVREGFERTQVLDVLDASSRVNVWSSGTGPLNVSLRVQDIICSFNLLNRFYELLNQFLFQLAIRRKRSVMITESKSCKYSS